MCLVHVQGVSVTERISATHECVPTTNFVIIIYTCHTPVVGSTNLKIKTSQAHSNNIVEGENNVKKKEIQRTIIFYKCIYHLIMPLDRNNKYIILKE